MQSLVEENGIRLALGATRGALFRPSAFEGLAPLLVGAALAVSVFVLLALASAALRPAIRATQLDPAAILRQQ